MAETKSKPILFSGAMVRALLEGRKTQTRRKIKKAVGPSLCVDYLDGAAELSWLYGAGPGHEVEERTLSIPCPHPVGSEMWVRETHSVVALFGNHYEGHASSAYRIEYRAGGERHIDYEGPRGGDAKYAQAYDRQRGEWRPSIFMPRWASRLTLTVTDVRVERLQDISEADAIAEGIADDGAGFNGGFAGAPWQRHPQDAYRNLWESINGPGSWDANPWVWVYTFCPSPQRMEVRHG